MSDFLSNFDSEPSVSKKKDTEDITELDPTYKRGKLIKIVIGALCSLLLFTFLFILYYQSTNIILPDFVKKEGAHGKSWGAKNNIEIITKEVYDENIEQGLVISQEKKSGSRIRKGTSLELTVSNGPDPEKLIKIPDFSTMSFDQSSKWVKDQKAENLKVVQEYSDDIENKRFLRLEFAKAEMTGSSYKRKDRATLYYSKGKEVFKKDVVVPNFTGKTKMDVQSWAEKNSIVVTYETIDSNTILMDGVISQSIPADEKIAKKDSMSVSISLGKAIVVPNFNNYTSEEAQSIPELTVMVRKVFHSTVPFGKLVSQSIGAGTKLLSTDDRVVTVTYSDGKPFLKDYRKLPEGDLASLFYADYHSKGANITYETQYIDSYEVKGTIADMSDYNTYVSSDFHVIIYISKGNLDAPTTPDTPPTEE